MFNNLILFIKDLWVKKAHKSLSFFERIIFAVLCFFEYIYKFVFFVDQLIKKYRGGKFVAGAKIVSVGNLSVGGTGKTVFIEFLVKFFKSQKSAIVSRGYGASFVGKNLLVCDGRNIFHSPDICGDEPYMLASNLNIVTVVGSDRYESCLLVKSASRDIEYILLDDAYQNCQLKKDFEILIVDARYPMGLNGHCLPAGDLREKDYLRADLIIISHADFVSSKDIEYIKNTVFLKFDSNKILTGIHKPIGLLQAGTNLVDSEFLKNKKFLLAAGIGSFSGFRNSVENFGINIVECIEFEDHHKYLLKDIDFMMQKNNQYNSDGIIVTQKDWAKISQVAPPSDTKNFFVFGIQFEFLFESQYSLFEKILSSKLK